MMKEARPMTILIIEDDEAFLDDIALILNMEGYSTALARTGEAGIERVLEGGIALVLCDLSLPGISGHEVIASLKKNPQSASIPVIIISGQTNPAEMVKALQFAEEYIVKPVEVEGLKARVKSMLRLRAAQESVEELNRSLEARVEERTRQLEEKTTQVQNLTDKLIAVRDEERADLASELHDDIGQQIVALKWKLQQELDRLGTDSETKRKIEGRLDILSDSVRGLSHQLSPIAFKNLGLCGALDRVVDDMRKSGLDIKLVMEDVRGFFPDDWSMDLIRVVQEGFLNIVKHSGADKATLSVKRSGSSLVVELEDNGKGFKETGAGLGLFTIRRRAEKMGASFEVISTGRGAVLKLEIPPIKPPTG